MGISKRQLVLILFSSVLAGCAAKPSALQFASQGQWESLGYQDGETGSQQRTALELNKLSTTTEQSFNDYVTGYSTGLASFCETENAYFEGVTGRLYKGQCKNMPNEEAFIAYCQEGGDQYEFEVLDRLWQETENDRYDDLMQEYTQEMN